MFTDARGHTITSDVAEAASEVDLAIQHLVGRRAAFSAAVAKARELDPECALAHVLAGLMACGLRKESGLVAAREALTAAEAQRTRVTEREQHYIDALAAATVRDADAVVDHLEAIVHTHPTDLLASVLIQGELFWTGDMQRSAAISARSDASWDGSVPGYCDWLALRAFDLEEMGELDAAEERGRASVELDPNNLWGAHAVAHVLEMRGDSAGGIRWLDQLHGGWDAGGPMKFHLWWHRCLCHIEQGDMEAALEIHDAWLRNPEQPIQQALPDFYLDIQNAASHLIRLELQGVDVGDRWLALADAIESSWQDLSNPFTTLHVAMILAATDQQDRLQSLIDAVDRLSRDSASAVAASYRDGPAVLRAIAAHRSGEHQTVVRETAAVRDALWRLGGSHAQRDVLFQLLYDSARQCRDQALLAAIGTDLERIGFVDPLQRVAYRAAS